MKPFNFFFIIHIKIHTQKLGIFPAGRLCIQISRLFMATKLEVELNAHLPKDQMMLT